MLEKNMWNDKNLEVNVAISQKKIELQNFWQQKWQETEWTKILRTDSVECLYVVVWCMRSKTGMGPSKNSVGNFSEFLTPPLPYQQFF